eukprot:359192-Chlamydomonas_euryale.AAC.1
MTTLPSKATPCGHSHFRPRLRAYLSAQGCCVAARAAERSAPRSAACARGRRARACGTQACTAARGHRKAWGEAACALGGGGGWWGEKGRNRRDMGGASR